MEGEIKLRSLKIVLYVLGIIFIVGTHVMMRLWPSAWVWTPRQPEFEQMLIGIYTILGVFLIWAARDPFAHVSLLWFTIWSSIVHGIIMFIQAILDETERTHLIGDIPALFLVAFVLWFFMPKRIQIQSKSLKHIE